MTIEVPPNGSVIRYPYLWRAQRESDEAEGRKSRPVCLVFQWRNEPQGAHHLALLAISSKPPALDQRAVPIPEAELRRAGLSRYAQGWVYVSEYNYDIAERSWYLDLRSPPFGQFSARFLKLIVTEFIPTLRRGTIRVDRT